LRDGRPGKIERPIIWTISQLGLNDPVQGLHYLIVVYLFIMGIVALSACFGGQKFDHNLSRGEI
jgi:hypothetical protein